MKVKRYYSASPYEAFKQIRAELGTEAVILYSQKVRQGGWLGWLRGPVYEVGVAVDASENEASCSGGREGNPHPNPLPLRREREQDGFLPLRKEREQDGFLPLRSEREQDGFLPLRSEREQDGFLPLRSEREQDGLLPLRKERKQDGLLPLRSEREQEACRRDIFTVDGAPEGVANCYGKKASSSESPSSVSLSEIKYALASMQEELGKLGSSANRSPGAGSRLPQVRRIGEHLLSAGLDPGLVSALSKEVRTELTRKALQNWETTTQVMRRKLEGSISAGATEGSSGRDPAVIFLVGPTGVGKTTTIAKLASRLRSSGASGVFMATIDSKRVGAIAQLQAYADILGLPLEVAYTPSELRRYISARSQREVTLVDTPGLSRKDRKGLAELSGFVDAVGSARVYLTLAAVARDEESIRTVVDYSNLPIDSLVITKLDEAENLGAAFNVPWRSGKPLAYLGTGQDVPEDLELADASVMARRLLGAPA